MSMIHLSLSVFFICLFFCLHHLIYFDSLNSVAPSLFAVHVFVWEDDHGTPDIIGLIIIEVSGAFSILSELFAVCVQKLLNSEKKMSVQ